MLVGVIVGVIVTVGVTVGVIVLVGVLVGVILGVTVGVTSKGSLTSIIGVLIFPTNLNPLYITVRSFLP